MNNFFVVYSSQHEKLFEHRFVKQLKKRPTEAEMVFKDCLISAPMYNRRLLRSDKKRIFQYPIPVSNSFYILDFFIESLSLGFEINGGIHNTTKGIEKDSRRRQQLEDEWGISVVDLDNQYVLANGRDKSFIKWLSAIIGVAYARKQCGKKYTPCRRPV